MLRRLWSKSYYSKTCVPPKISTPSEKGPDNVMPRGAEDHLHEELDDLTGVRVLLSEPDENLADYYERFLSECGAVVARARTGLECIEQLRTFRPQVLVLEPEMRWGSGDGVIAWMLDDEQLPTTPVIVLTAARDLRQLQQILKFPLYDLIVKPLPARALAKKVRWVVDYSPGLGNIGWPRT